LFLAALKKNGITSKMLTYEKGRHGSLAERVPEVAR
jgi:dipeptidyl aminopeptidase/acylaminoacyl peptidase